MNKNRQYHFHAILMGQPITVYCDQVDFENKTFNYLETYHLLTGLKISITDIQEKEIHKLISILLGFKKND